MGLALFIYTKLNLSWLWSAVFVPNDDSFRSLGRAQLQEGRKENQTWSCRSALYSLNRILSAH